MSDKVNGDAGQSLAAATGSAFSDHLKAAFEHLCEAQNLYPPGKDVFTISGHVERAKHDCKSAARLAGVLPNDKLSDGSGS